MVDEVARPGVVRWRVGVVVGAAVLDVDGRGVVVALGEQSFGGEGEGGENVLRRRRGGAGRGGDGGENAVAQGVESRPVGGAHRQHALAGQGAGLGDGEPQQGQAGGGAAVAGEQRLGVAETAGDLGETSQGEVLVAVGPFRRGLVGELREQRGELVVGVESVVVGARDEAAQRRFDRKLADLAGALPEFRRKVGRGVGQVEAPGEGGARPRRQGRGRGGELTKRGAEPGRERFGVRGIAGAGRFSDRRYAAGRGQVVEDQPGRFPGPQDDVADGPRRR